MVVRCGMRGALATHPRYFPSLRASALLTTLAIVILLLLRSRKARTRSDEEREAEWLAAAAEVELVDVSRIDRRDAAEDDGPQKDDTKLLQDLSAEEVALTLHSVGFGAYAPAFSRQQITGQDLMFFRSPDELYTAGVETLVSTQVLSTAIATTHTQTIFS